MTTMTTATTRYVDELNIVLIALSCVVAHFFPYHLLIFSYAVLGPAHYLTQISWLHDRRYFSTSTYIAPAFVLLTIFIILLPKQAGIFLSLALGVALAVVLPPRWHWRILGLLCGVLLACFSAEFGPAQLFFSALLPTVLHVFVFTACFMCLGAMKGGNASGWLALLALLAGGASFIFPLGQVTVPNLNGLVYFRETVDYMQSLLKISSATSAQLFGFLSFAYTYHYLNWFSKAEVIHWNKIPRTRLIAIVVIYAVALSVYVYNFEAGFLLLLFLSVLHVLLEFPLNLRSFAMIAGF